MASIGKFALAAVSASQETTLALANFNFDFSIVKMQADVEYRGIGNALSVRRRNEAEDGKTHATARKLGALFSEDLPEIPHLHRAYGLRVTEIMEDPKFNPRGSNNDGPYFEHVGADATSLWAAATSGKGAIEVHFLACLLARMWKAHEAVSIWSEILEIRRTVLENRSKDQPLHIATVMASKIIVSREKLAEWDASARAWLEIADKAKVREQKQLMLIIDNMDLQIPPRPDVYQEVMNVWINSMLMVDHLISGIPQSIHRGEGLLGLCAWHLYPDICAIGDKTTMVDQHDSLVSKGGIVTLGLSYPKDEDKSGLRWSMPLTHSRYYGKAVMSHESVRSGRSKASLHRILQIAIGSIASRWPSRCADVDKILRFLIAFADGIDNAIDNSEERDRWRKYWPYVFAQEAKIYMTSSDEERKEFAKHVDRGRRRHHGFLVGEGISGADDFFELEKPNFYIHLLQPEDRVDALRDQAKFYQDDEEFQSAIIICKYSGNEVQTDPSAEITEFATVFPQLIPGTEQRVHRRWILLPKPATGSEDVDGTDLKRHEEAAIQRSIEIILRFKEPCGFLDPDKFREEGFVIAELQDPGDYTQISTVVHWDAGETPLSLEYLQNHRASVKLSASSREKCLDGWRNGYAEHSYTNIKYEKLFGNNKSAMVFVRYKSSGFYRRSSRHLPIEFFTNAISKGHIDCSKMKKQFARNIDPHLTSRYGEGSYFRSLMILAKAVDVYATMPNAEVDIGVVQFPLHTIKWYIQDEDLPQTVLFCFVAFFQTGYLVTGPDDMGDVIAISFNNSIFTSGSLFHDPIQLVQKPSLRHIIGNVGRPGLSFLILAKDPMVRKPELDIWEQVNHERFDSEFQNNFSSTTLHLSLTGYVQPLNTQRHGSRDKEHFYVEAVISVYDRGDWIADLDLYKTVEMFKNTPAMLMVQEGDGSHTDEERKDFSAFEPMTSIDNWYELLDPPKNAAVIRARGNWLARLALASIAVEYLRPLVVADGRLCWTCVQKKIKATRLSEPRNPSIQKEWIEDPLFLC